MKPSKLNPETVSQLLAYDDTTTPDELRAMIDHARRMLGVLALEGRDLAQEYLRTHPLNEMNPGKMWALWNEDDQRVEVSGNGLNPHPSLRGLYPDGWSLRSTVTADQARVAIITNHAELRAKYKEAK